MVRRWGAMIVLIPYFLSEVALTVYTWNVLQGPPAMSLPQIAQTQSQQSVFSFASTFLCLEAKISWCFDS
jgi:hypothetical protein